MGRFKLNENTPFYTIEKFNEENWKVGEEVKQGLYVFGKQCGLITNENLTDDIAEWLLTKPEFALYIEDTKKTTIHTIKNN